MAKQQSITSLPRSPEDDRRSRMIKYSVTMAIRVVCIALCLVVQGWWVLVFAIGAVALPYIAVVLANSVMSPSGPPVLRPGSIVSVQAKEAVQAKEQPTHDGSGAN
jgi:hypothetical protein